MLFLLWQVQLVSCKTGSCKAVPEQQRIEKARLIKNLICAEAKGVKESCCVTKVLANTTVFSNDQREAYTLPLKAW